MLNYGLHWRHCTHRLIWRSYAVAVYSQCLVYFHMEHAEVAAQIVAQRTSVSTNLSTKHYPLPQAAVHLVRMLVHDLLHLEKKNSTIFSVHTQLKYMMYSHAHLSLSRAISILTPWRGLRAARLQRYIKSLLWPMYRHVPPLPLPSNIYGRKLYRYDLFM